MRALHAGILERVLLQYLDSSKVRYINGREDLDDLIQSTYGLATRSYFVQKFDSEFNEFVDLEDLDVQHKDKIKI
ncbi:hypothetical protein JTE90_013379 [Oedothorax gibbosus]|uniref:Uncharacterized protein n=1 Tax=Oedothorax gibbosus TaxID=931172 RepID=A0AAV6TVR4_9ARAC|nr:hypothetical protein JTE90_013379 [Oedothorax gibbosus]